MDEIKKKFQIVVARYNEDITWLLPFIDITTIYNKGDDNIALTNFNIINLNNVGREGHTYLYHIIHNYDNLAEKTIFFQGKIDDHKIIELESYFDMSNTFIGKTSVLEIDKLKKKIEHFGKWKTEYQSGNMRISNYSPFEWLTKIIGINIDEKLEVSKVVWGANFSISRDIIISKPVSFYKNILRFLDNHKNPEEGHFLERTWYLIFNNNFRKKKNIGYFYTDKFVIPTSESNNVSASPESNNSVKTNYDEIHVWLPILANFEHGIENKINYTPNNNKYLIIKPNIVNNTFYIDIKGNNDAHVLIEFDNSEDKYEIVFGGWNNKKSIIRNYNTNTIIGSYDGSILNKDKFVRFNFVISDKIIISGSNNILIFNIKNIFNKSLDTNSHIKNIKIKSYFNSSIYWDYDHNFNVNNDINNDINTKLNNTIVKKYLCNNIYDDIKLFYTTQYLDYYVEKINLTNYI